MSAGNNHDDFAFEPIPGLPERPPEGERILWQGSPNRRGMAWRAFHVRDVTVYFAALAAAQPVLALVNGTSLLASGKAMLWVCVSGAAAIGALALLGWLSARGTVYTITNRRLVMRFGIALPMTINLPFAVVAEAGLNRRRDGSGDLSIGIAAGERVSYVVLWPHARPWRLGRPEPMLREVGDAARVADILGRALAAHANAPVRIQPATASNDQRLPAGIAAAS